MAIDQESVSVVSVVEVHREEPPAVRHLLHRMRGRVPLIEVGDETDGLGLWCVADEVDGA
jgi:hypothetical protein